MISVNYTSPSKPFQSFSKKKKKKKKETLINQIVCAYSANNHDASANHDASVSFR